MSLPRGPDRDTVLRDVSRNLRHAHPDLARRAAAGMVEAYERESFTGRPDPVLIGLNGMWDRQADLRRACAALGVLGPPERASAAELARRDETARECAYLNGISEVDRSAFPPVATVLAVARVLPVGMTRAELLYHALYRTWDDKPEVARHALAELRRSAASLRGEDRDAVREMLDDWHVDLLDGDIDAAIARVRADALGPEAFPMAASAAVAGLATALAKADRTGDAIRAIALLPSDECQGTSGLSVLPSLASGIGDARKAALFVSRLIAAPELRRVCPNGLPPEHLAAWEFDAGRYDRALAAADRVADPATATEVRLRVVQVRREAGSLADARTLALRTAAALPRVAGADGRRNLARRLRLQALLELARLGEGDRAETLAAGLDTPGRRAVALSAMVGEFDRARAPNGWAGPTNDLP